jgi:hypothetical protein
MGGNQDRADIANKAYDQLVRLGYVEDDIQNTLEIIFSLEEVVEGGLLSGGIHNIVFDMYEPRKRVPLELLLLDEKDKELQDSFHDLYEGTVSPEQFELYIEAGDNYEVPDDTVN